MSALPAPIEVFYSYAYVDEPFCNKLEKHLSLWRHEGLITTWYQRQILPGMDWKKTVDRHLNTASVILLLISDDFLASDYCYGVEMQRAMQRYEAGEARVIPVLLRPVNWQGALFGKLKALPSNGTAITQWRNRDEAFAHVAQGIRVALEDIQRLVVNAPPTTFPRIWNIPYQRNLVFTGREDVLRRLTETLKATTRSQPQAISGLGGIGKTQIVVEYAYQHSQDYQAVFWVLADIRESLVSGYVALAKLLNLPEKDERDQTITVKAVKQWLTTHSEWLLILDNADELTIVREFVPPVFGGHIVLTTRAQTTGTWANRIEVESMSQYVGTLFLLRRAKFLTSDAPLETLAPANIGVAKEICEQLGGLPLALDQAGAYIEETQCSLNHYQSLYRTRQAEMLKRRGQFADDYPQSVATTWSLSFEKVEQRCPAARDLLRICAYLASDAIPEEIIIEGAEHLGALLQPVAADPLLFDEAISALRAYSLMRRNPVARNISLHRLVQAVTRDALLTAGGKQWVLRAVSAVNATFPDPSEFAEWAACERWLPHALTCAIWIEQEPMIFPKAAILLNNTAYYLDERARHAEAEPLYKLSLSINEKKSGAEHPNTAAVLNNLASLYVKQGKYTETEPLYQRALSIYEKQLGIEHPNTAQVINNLAALYNAEGKYSEAEPLARQALTLRERQMGAEHLGTAQSLGILASICNAQGKDIEAEPLYRRALAIYEKQLGADHPSTAKGLNNLASLYNRQGKYAEAEPLLRRALSIYEQQMGTEHPDMVLTLNNLAYFYHAQEKYAEAESLYWRALSIYEKQLGAEHPSTARTLGNLASLYDAQGKYAEAEPLYRRALSIYEKQLGADHPDTALILSNLASHYEDQRKYTEAEPLARRALSIYEKQLGAEHPKTQITRKQYATLLRFLEQGRDLS